MCTCIEDPTYNDLVASHDKCVEGIEDRMQLPFARQTTGWILPLRSSRMESQHYRSLPKTRTLTERATPLLSDAWLSALKLPSIECPIGRVSSSSVVMLRLLERRGSLTTASPTCCSKSPTSWIGGGAGAISSGP